MSFLKRYLIAGLLVWLPLGVTIAVVKFLVDFFDNSLLLLPAKYRPENFIGLDIPGLGVLLSFLLILFTGFLVANILGSKLINIWEAFLSRIPLVRSLYKAVKQIAEAVLGSGEQTFQNVYLIEYPRKGLWTLALETGKNISEPQRKTGMANVVNLFVPTTPNPTSGFFIMADRSELVKLDLDVDDALKMVISGGVVSPDSLAKKAKKVTEVKESA